MINPAIGDIIDKYRITDIIGKGAAATVYKVQHIYLDKIFAMKVLSPQLISEMPDMAERFLTEARYNTRLSHDSIVKVTDFEKSEKYTYMVMEFIEGYTLEEITRKLGAVPPLPAIKIILEICGILQFALKKNLTHRGIKPGNIILSKASKVKLADFGLAKLVTETDKYLDSEGIIYGTPFYMSPEQFKNSENTDHRSDLYSLGATFYHILTGRVPFETSSLKELINKKLNEKPPPPSSFNNIINSQLDQLIMKLLEKEPEKRYQDYSELIRDIEKIASTYQNLGFEKSNTEQYMEKYQRYQNLYNRFDESAAELNKEEKEKEELNHILEKIHTAGLAEELESVPGLADIITRTGTGELGPEVSDRLQQKYLKYLDKDTDLIKKRLSGPLVAKVSPPMLKNSAGLKSGEVKLSKATTGNLQEKYTDFDKKKVKASAPTYIDKIKNLFKK